MTKKLTLSSYSEFRDPPSSWVHVFNWWWYPTASWWSPNWSSVALIVSLYVAPFSVLCRTSAAWSCAVVKKVRGFSTWYSFSVLLQHLSFLYWPSNFGYASILASIMAIIFSVMATRHSESIMSIHYVGSNPTVHNSLSPTIQIS
jgi:hypothetical protein